MWERDKDMSSICNWGQLGARGHLSKFYALLPTAECNIDCGGHGKCDRPNVCTCNKGYKGLTCKDPDCQPPCVEGQGFCTGPNKCDCMAGWSGADCSQRKLDPASFILEKVEFVPLAVIASYPHKLYNT